VDAEQGQKLGVRTFRMLTFDFVREYGLRFALIDDRQFPKVVLWTPSATEDRPTFRIAILFKPSKVTIARRQAGHLVGEADKVDMVYGKSKPIGNRFRRLIHDLISDERLRLMDYRKLHG
jgi:hypothetical protein